MSEPERMEYELDEERPGLPFRWLALIALLLWGGAWWLAN
jgi:hypothetical protein